MTYILVPVIVILVIMVVVSLVRGIAAFLKSTRDELERGEGDGGDGPTQAQIQQNRMMFARIKYQAAAVVVIAFLLAFARH
ncbi:MAG: HIG1 domain-containing protein [Sphingomonadales bacterium]|nr:HIG1 domain-containing protein [Sphingomonadales bacterium]